MREKFLLILWRRKLSVNAIRIFVSIECCSVDDLTSKAYYKQEILLRESSWIIVYALWCPHFITHWFNRTNTVKSERSPSTFKIHFKILYAHCFFTAAESYIIDQRNNTHEFWLMMCALLFPTCTKDRSRKLKAFLICSAILTRPNNVYL